MKLPSLVNLCVQGEVVSDDGAEVGELADSIEFVVKRVKTPTYLGWTLAADGELDAEVTRRVQSGWKNGKRGSGVLCDRTMNEKIKGRCMG